jgi:hypothetical protein
VNTFKRIVAWIFVVLSIVGMLVVVAGIGYSWVLRNRVTTITVNLLTAGETAVAASSNATARVENRLDTSQTKITTLENNIVSAGADLTENSLVMAAISNTLSEETAMAITDARATAVSMSETIVALDAAITAANQIPFVTLDGIVPTLVSDLSDSLVQLEADITAFRTAVETRREERITNSVGFFTGITGEMTSTIGDIQARVDEINGRLDTTATRLADAKVSLPRTFTWITIGVNLFLALIVVAFISLLLQSWAFAHNPQEPSDHPLPAIQ